MSFHGAYWHEKEIYNNTRPARESHSSDSEWKCCLCVFRQQTHHCALLLCILVSVFHLWHIIDQMKKKKIEKWDCFLNEQMVNHAIWAWRRRRRSDVSWHSISVWVSSCADELSPVHQMPTWGDDLSSAKHLHSVAITTSRTYLRGLLPQTSNTTWQTRGDSAELCSAACARLSSDLLFLLVL